MRATFIDRMMHSLTTSPNVALSINLSAKPSNMNDALSQFIHIFCVVVVDKAVNWDPELDVCSIIPSYIEESEFDFYIIILTCIFLALLNPW